MKIRAIRHSNALVAAIVLALLVPSAFCFAESTDPEITFVDATKKSTRNYGEATILFTTGEIKAGIRNRGDKTLNFVVVKVEFSGRSREARLGGGPPALLCTANALIILDPPLKPGESRQVVKSVFIRDTSSSVENVDLNCVQFGAIDEGIELLGPGRVEGILADIPELDRVISVAKSHKYKYSDLSGNWVYPPDVDGLPVAQDQTETIARIEAEAKSNADRKLLEAREVEYLKALADGSIPKDFDLKSLAGTYTLYSEVDKREKLCQIEFTSDGRFAYKTPSDDGKEIKGEIKLEKDLLTVSVKTEAQSESCVLTVRLRDNTLTLKHIDGDKAHGENYYLLANASYKRENAR